MASQNNRYPIQTPDRFLLLSIRNLKLLGGSQIIFGIICMAMNIYGTQYYGSILADLNNITHALTDPKKSYCDVSPEDCKSLISCLAYSVTSMVLSSLFISTGIIPLCISVNRVEAIRKKRLSFMVCSLVCAAVSCPVIIGLSISERKKLPSMFYLVSYVNGIKGVKYSESKDFEMNMDIITTKLMIVAVELIIGLMSACMCWRCAYWPDQVGFKELYDNQSHVFGLSQTQQLDFPRDPYDQNWNRQHHPFVHKETPFNGGSTQSLSALPRNAYTNYPQWNGEQQVPVHRNSSYPRDRIEAPTSWMIPRNNRSRQQDNPSPYDEPLFDQRRWPDVGQSRTNAGSDHFNDNRQRHPEYPPKTSYQLPRAQQQPNSYQSYRNWEHHY